VRRMKMRLKEEILNGARSLITIGLIGCFLPVIAVSQAAVEVTTTDGISTAVDTLGINIDGTYCLECPVPSFSLPFCEVELPPLIPSIFDVRFVESRLGSSCLGTGVRVNFQNGDPIKPDTFWLSINQPDTDAYPISVSWRFLLDYSYGYIDADILFESMWMTDTGEGLLTPVNMLTDSVVTISDRRLSVIQIVTTTTFWTDVHEEYTLPLGATLLQNYPNPFNPKTTISYLIAVPEIVELSVYDILGRRVSVLDQGRKSAGVHEVQFDAAELPGGLYLVRLATHSYSQSIKVLYAK
jgi:hypothetical protein